MVLVSILFILISIKILLNVYRFLNQLICKPKKMWPFSRKGENGFGSFSTAEEVTKGIDGIGLTAIVTGASSGIGLETARVLALRGVHVVMAVRDLEKGRKVKETILEETPDAKVEVMELDLGSLASVRKFATEYCSSGLPLNILINNAGRVASSFMLSKDGIEIQFATNHLGHFLLTNLLLETMKDTSRKSEKEGRIVNVSSEGHRLSYKGGINFDKINDESSYNSLYAYGQSKLANVLHANELARRFKEDNVELTANSLHPGAIATSLLRDQGILNTIFKLVGKLAFKSIPQGAATTCYVALHPQVKGVSGQYFSNSNKLNPSSDAKDLELGKKLWDFSVRLVDPRSD